MSEAANSTENNSPVFDIHRIYVKNVSVESPSTPGIFRENHQPEISIQLSNLTNKMEDDLKEICLRITVTAKVGEETMFLVEVEQAGVFTMKGFSEEQEGHMEGAYCPTILFPYARETIDTLIIKAGFPPIMLAPVNFDMLYAQRLEQMKAEGNAQFVDVIMNKKTHYYGFFIVQNKVLLNINYADDFQAFYVNVVQRETFMFFCFCIEIQIRKYHEDL